MLKPETPTERMTEAQFFEWIEGQEGKFELVDGQVVGMAGGSLTHGRIARNLLTSLTLKLRGSGCEALGSDVALRTGPDQIRYPDVHVHCGTPKEAGAEHALENPTIVFEVASPSTWRGDRIVKTAEYKAMPSVRSIVLVLSATRSLDVYERVSATEWRNTTLLPGTPLRLGNPDLVLTPEDIFGEEESAA